MVLAGRPIVYRSGDWQISAAPIPGVPQPLQSATGSPLAEGPTAFAQAFFNATGVDVGQINAIYPGNGTA